MKDEKTAKATGSKPKQKGFKVKAWHFIFLAGVALATYLFIIVNYYPFKQDLKHRPDFFGVTFSTKFCRSLGLDWKETYNAMLNELKVKYVRIPVYWDEIEKEKGKFDFSDYDYILDAGKEKNVKFVLAIGRRLPRWPECHEPDWVDGETGTALQVDSLEMIKTTVDHFKNRPEVEYWQLENEPLLNTFGVCSPFDPNFLKQEFDFVRSLDSRKLIITGSGEFSSWSTESEIGDIFGSTLYRIVYDKYLGYVKYPFPLAYYRTKAWLSGLSSDRLMVMELQAEPWVPSGLMSELTSEQIDKSMSIKQFRSNLQYAINLNFSRTYLWGVEWWYWQKKYGNPEYWWLATVLF